MCHLRGLREIGDHIGEEDEAVMKKDCPVVPENVAQLWRRGLRGRDQGEAHHGHSGEGDRVQL